MWCKILHRFWGWCHRFSVQLQNVLNILNPCVRLPLVTSIFENTHVSPILEQIREAVQMNVKMNRRKSNMKREKKVNAPKISGLDTPEPEAHSNEMDENEARLPGFGFGACVEWRGGRIRQRDGNPKSLRDRAKESDAGREAIKLEIQKRGLRNVLHAARRALKAKKECEIHTLFQNQYLFMSSLGLPVKDSPFGRSRSLGSSRNELAHTLTDEMRPYNTTWACPTISTTGMHSRGSSRVIRSLAQPRASPRDVRGIARTDSYTSGMTTASRVQIQTEGMRVILVQGK
ncbi:hypothetical protein DFH07DRAFT_1023821 [Mycena maculata]|uniref:Uncharacterized protein n=1 Tax=Mycena maculata TaxID=230809 RepID=A0AAD7JC19_9AGAR|nr:hypothetical protein DFH07DRAFT_1023821 [Mycena maculata]